MDYTIAGPQIVLSTATAKYWRCDAQRTDWSQGLTFDAAFAVTVTASASPRGISGLTPTYKELQPNVVTGGPWAHVRTVGSGVLAFAGWVRLVETDEDGNQI